MNRVTPTNPPTTHSTAPEVAYRYLRIAAERFGAVPTALDDSQRQEVERIAAYEADMEKRVLGSPEAAKVSIPDSQLALALDQIRERYPSTEEFDQALAGLGMDEQALAMAVRRSLRVESVLDLVASQAVRVSDTDARLFYYLHPEKFQRPERRGVRQILLTVNEDLKGSDEPTVIQKIGEIANRLQRHPDRFATQALKHSECPTAMNEGWLGDVPRGVLYGELEARLYQMVAGEVSMPVRTELGWHVLKCDHILPADTAPLAEVIDGLKERLQDQQDRRVQRQWLAQRTLTPGPHTSGRQTSGTQQPG